MSHVQSVERTFAILEAVATSGEAVSTTEIAQQVGLPKSTVARLLLTLQQEGAIDRVAGTRFFRIGPRLFSLMAGVPFPDYIRYFVRPFLQNLTDRTGEASAVCLLDANQLFVADSVQSQYLVNVQDSVGDRSPLHLTSPGRVFLAFWPEAKLEQYLSEIALQTGTEPPVNPAKLRIQLAEIRERGYAWSLEDSTEITGIAAPIQLQTEAVVACLNLFGPAFRFPPEGKQTYIARIVLETSQEISSRLQKTIP